MTTGLDDFQRRLFSYEEAGEKRRQEKILKMLLKERETLLETWKGRPEYIQGLEHAIHLIGGDKVID